MIIKHIKMTEQPEKFKFFIPAVEFEKAADAGGKEVRRLRGVASNNEKDFDGEILEPDGFDLSLFKTSGLVNYNHQAKNDPSAVIGEPEIAYVKDNVFFIQAKLYNNQKAKDTYDLAETLANDSDTRKLGWSIEGKVLKRDPFDKKRVLKALITNVAVTPSPKNFSTWADVVKGNYLDIPYEYDEVEILEKAEENNLFGENKRPANGGEFHIIDITKPNGDRIIVDEYLNIKIITKALAATMGSGQVLKREDLESELKYPKEVVKSMVILSTAMEKGIFNESESSKIKEALKENF
jgi:hypothetical protein